MCGIFPTDCGNNFYKQKVSARMQAQNNSLTNNKLKAIDYLLFQIKEAAPKTAAFSLIPEASNLIFPL
jgi:hypothetical protein